MVKALAKAEAKLFGNTSERSSVIVLPPKVSKDPETMSPPDRNRNPGQRYLGYGLFEDRDRPPQCIPAGSNITFECVLKTKTGKETIYLDLACATLWTWAALGGLGARSRRGYGSVWIKSFRASQQSATIDKWNDLLKLHATPDQYLASLGQGIGRAQEAMNTFLNSEGLGKAQLADHGGKPHPSIRSLDGIAHLRGLRHTYKTGLDALEHAGSLFRNFRSTLQRNNRKQPPLADYFEVKESLKRNRPPRHVGRAAFGLPLPFYFRTLGGKRTSFRPKPKSGKSDRLASPLLFRVFRLAANNYGIALINLAGKQTAPPLQGCDLANKHSNGTTPAPSENLIRDFIEWAVSQPPPSNSANTRRRRPRNHR